VVIFFLLLFLEVALLLLVRLFLVLPLFGSLFLFELLSRSTDGRSSRGRVNGGVASAADEAVCLVKRGARAG
jgi:hypothetical protein